MLLHGVGAGVGSRVGVEVGARVGGVGCGVGNGDGYGVGGVGVGASVGAGVGSMVTGGVGVFVGMDVGPAVGARVRGCAHRQIMRGLGTIFPPPNRLAMAPLGRTKTRQTCRTPFGVRALSLTARSNGVVPGLRPTDQLRSKGT